MTWNPKQREGLTAEERRKVLIGNIQRRTKAINKQRQQVAWMRAERERMQREALDAIRAAEQGPNG